MAEVTERAVQRPGGSQAPGDERESRKEASGEGAKHGCCRGCRSEQRTHSSYGTSATGTSMGAGFGFLSRLALAGAGGVGAGSGGGDWSLFGVVSPIVGVHRRAGFTVLGAVAGAVCTLRRLGGAPWPPGSGPRRVEPCESDTKGAETCYLAGGSGVVCPWAQGVMPRRVQLGSVPFSRSAVSPRAVKVTIGCETQAYPRINHKILSSASSPSRPRPW